MWEPGGHGDEGQTPVTLLNFWYFRLPKEYLRVTPQRWRQRFHETPQTYHVLRFENGVTEITSQCKGFAVQLHCKTFQQIGLDIVKLQVSWNYIMKLQL